MTLIDLFDLNVLKSYLLIGAALFCALGMLGFLTRRNLIVMFLSVEMMLQGMCFHWWHLVAITVCGPARCSRSSF